MLRVGQGWDLHRVVPGGTLRLGGVEIPFDGHLLGHSDGDVVLHAAADALLGAVAAGDLGTHFPDSDERYLGADSADFLRRVVDLLEARGARPCNADVTVLAEAPRIGPHRERMRRRIASLLRVDVDRVSVKAKTTEGLGAIGRGEAIAALVIVSVEQG